VKSRILVVSILALALAAGDALAQELKRVPRPPAENATDEQKATAEGAVSQPALVKPPPVKTLGGSDSPLGGSTPTISPTIQPRKEMGIGSGGPDRARAPVPDNPLRGMFSCETITCVERIRVNPSGTHADFEVITTQPAHIAVEVGLMRPSNHQFSRVERAIFTLQDRISSKTQLTGLTPDHTYHYVVKVTGKDSRVAWEEGVFSTSGRKVDFVIESFRVIDDGDDGGLDPGEFYIHFGVMDHTYSWSGSMDSGETKAVNKTLSLTGVPPSLRVDLNVLEDDDSIHGPGGVRPRPGPNRGERYTGNYNVETPQTRETRSFDLTAANGEYNMVVKGKLHISYE
jgi:hypothetical protein